MSVENFSSFLTRVAEAQPGQYSDAIRGAAERQGLSVDEVTAEVEHMKNYILSYYREVTPVCSFLHAGGQVIDCVPFDQLPTVRAAREAGCDTQAPAPEPVPVSGASPPSDPSAPSGPRSGIASPPDSPTPPISTPDTSVGEPARPQPQQCPPGTVPLPRVTLERLISMGRLDRFFRK